MILAHEQSGSFAHGIPEYARVVRFEGDETLYPTGGAVGKSCNQVGRTLDGSITASDSSIYDKWSQAVGSAEDLIARAHYDAKDADRRMFVSLVVPVLVVPDVMLWMSEYDESGTRIKEPARTERIPYYIDKTHVVGDKLTNISYAMSHLEIVTETGLQGFIESEWFNERRRNVILSAARALDLVDD